MNFSTDDARKIVAALGINTDSLPAERLAQIAHDVCRTDVLVSALDSFLRNKFAPEIIRAMSDADRGKLANRVAPQLLALQEKRPAQWEVFIYGAVDFKVAVRVICPVCRCTDGFFPLPDKGPSHNKTFPTVQEQMVAARAFRFQHCGRKEEIPTLVLADFERRIQPYCHGYKATAGELENAYIEQQNKSALSERPGPPAVPILR